MAYKVYEVFQGQLTGKKNEMKGNLGSDLCIEDYPWPPGFRKQLSIEREGAGAS